MTVSAPQNPRYLLVQEEYGYRHWIGVIPSEMTVESVIEWWKALPSVMGMFFNPSKSFPLPTLIELEDIADDDADKATWRWVDAQGEHILDRSNVVLFAHVHMDDDSYLKIPQGETFYHAGYGEMPFADEEEEFDEPPTEEQIREWASESELSKKVLQALHPEVKL
jgi:hypothetical protein